jgi:hypothetical protein
MTVLCAKADDLVVLSLWKMKMFLCHRNSIVSCV